MEVVNLKKGCRLGCVLDVEIDLCNGCIKAIIVSGAGDFCGFLRQESEYVIPLSCIMKFGEDFILVDIDERQYLCRETGKKAKEKRN